MKPTFFRPPTWVIKENLGAQVCPSFGRQGDMFGVTLNSREASSDKRSEQVFESFYRLRPAL